MASVDFATTVILGVIQIIIAMFALWQNYILRPHKVGEVLSTWFLRRCTDEEVYFMKTQTLVFP